MQGGGGGVGGGSRDRPWDEKIALPDGRRHGRERRDAVPR
jgi:hypothetical protein